MFTFKIQFLRLELVIPVLRNILTCLLLSAPFVHSGQNQVAKWYFGNNAGLDFMTTPPSVISSTNINSNANSSVCDPAGNLLFYTDGMTVWDKLHGPMGSIPGTMHSVNTQGALIVKQPGNNNIYFVFTLKATGLNFSTVDMSLAAGLGSLTAINTTLFPGFNSSALAAVPNCNGNVWVVMHDFGVHFRSFLVTATGVNPTPVTSTLNPVVSIVNSKFRFSQQGNRLAAFFNSGGGLNLFDFDLTTGIVSNRILLGNYNFPEFSPDGTKLYATNSIGVYQWDLCDPDSAAIVTSIYTVSTTGGLDTQLGPDGKIYITKYTSSLSVIHNPNAKGPNVNFDSNGLSILPFTSGGLLPKFVAGYRKETPQAANPTHTIGIPSSCHTASFTAPDICVPPGYTLSGVQWDFGDPMSGSLNSSPLLNPTHQYSGTGTYTAQMVIYFGGTCGTETDTVFSTVSVNVPAPVLSSGSATFCTTQSVVLNAGTGGDTYTWLGPLNFTSTLENPEIQNPAPQHSGIYSVTASNSLGCIDNATLDILILPAPVLNISLSSPSLCAQALNGSPNTITFTNSGAASYTLYTAGPIVSTDPTKTVVPASTDPPYLPTGIATATLIGANGACVASKTVTFTIVPNPTIAVATPTPFICAGHTYTYTSFGAQSYVWTSSTPNFTSWSNGGVATTDPEAQAVFSVYGSSLGCNSALKTTSLDVHPIPTVTVSPEQNVICRFGSVQLTAGGNAESYHWQPAVDLNSSAGKIVFASPSSDVTFTVTGTALGCTNAAVAEVKVKELPVPEITASKGAYCPGETMLLTASGGTAYEWSGANVGQQYASTVAIEALAPGNLIYTVTATDGYGCRGSAIKEVSIHPLPGGHLSGQKAGCAPLCTGYSFSGNNTTGTWSIMTTDNKIVSVSGSMAFSFCFKNPGEYVLRGSVNDSITQCITTRRYDVVVHEKPKADFYWLPEKPIAGIEEIRLISNAAGTEQTQWQWLMESDDSFSVQTKNTHYLFMNEGSYPVVHTIQNAWGCADTAIRIIEVTADFSLYVPDAFTPDGDSRNDMFIPIVNGIKKYQLLIFDRWGERVFETTNPGTGWDGTFRGSACKQDTYAWKITLTTTSGEIRQSSGSVLLLR